MATVEDDARPEGEMTLIEHLTELRTRIIRSVVAIGIGAIVCFILNDQIVEILIAPYCDALPEDAPSKLIDQENCGLVQTQVGEGFSVVFTVATYGGLMLAMPIVLWQAWQFIVPGLYPHERRWAVPFVASGATLFFAGAGLAYWSIPRALDFLLGIGGDRFQPLLSPGPYIAFVTKMLVAFGIGFQFPLVLIFMQIIGLVQTDTLKQGRRYALVGIVVLVAVLTPSGDPYTLLAMTVPMYLFYEIAIIFGTIRNRRIRRAAKSGAG